MPPLKALGMVKSVSATSGGDLHHMTYQKLTIKTNLSVTVELVPGTKMIPYQPMGQWVWPQCCWRLKCSLIQVVCCLRLTRSWCRTAVLPLNGWNTVLVEGAGRFMTVCACLAEPALTGWVGREFFHCQWTVTQALTGAAAVHPCRHEVAVSAFDGFRFIIAVTDAPKHHLPSMYYYLFFYLKSGKWNVF